MASAYPSGFDSLAKPTETTLEDDAGFEHDIVHTDEANAIEAVQATLGLNPEGAFTTVDDRIADLEVLGKPVLSKVRNSTGATLTKGTAVYLSGATGNHVNVTKALATSDATSARTQGFVWEDIANNADGYVIVEGYLENIDTSAAASDGQIVYLSGSVAGGWTVTKPVAPIHMVYLGVIAKKNPSTGVIYVKVQNGFELDEIHDVLIVSEANGDLLKYDSASGLWKNAAQSTLTVTQSQVTNLTTDLAGKVGTARTISTTAPLAGGGDLSANRTLTIADATTSVKGAVQLTDSTSSTSTTTAATPNAVKSAYDLANGAVAKSLVDAKGDLIVGTADDTVGRLASSATNGQVLTVDTSTGTGLKWASAAAGGYSTVYNRQQSFIQSRSSSGTTRTINSPSNQLAAISVGDTIVVAVGSASYDGTFTVATKPTNSRVTYTAGSSLTESTTNVGGTVGWTSAVTQRSDLTIYGGAVASDASSRTQLLVNGRMDTTPTTGNNIFPILTSITDSSYTSYQTMKAVPIYLAEAGINYNTIKVKVNASSSVGDIRYGVYSSNFDYTPHRLIQDFGTAALVGAGAPLNQNKTISWTVPEAGLYWLVMCLQTSSAGSPSVTQGTVQPYTNLAQAPSSYEVSSVTGAFALAPSWSAAAAPTLAPAISLQRS
jgi:hypothetical protein